jgi:hypothetical protein
MYPSGRWRGYWEQVFWGRQTMRELVLNFANGRIDGQGVDIIGRFTFTGEYDQHGQVVLIKRYLGKHEVLYRGRYDGEGTIYGQWNIGEQWRGPFALSPENMQADAEEPILRIEAMPPRRREDHIVPEGIPVLPAKDEDR